jgi:NAD(P)-dependent dehydrogenase (short-subunit alcohol dehydrogenase family)
MIGAAGGSAFSLAVDVTREDAVAECVQETLRRYGRLDCAFNNAGVALAGDGEWNDAVMRKTIEVNLMGVILCIRYEIPAMQRSGGGTIVNTASLSGFVASRTVFQPAYTASKHAVIGVTKSAALQYARHNIRVNALCPGVTHTAMVQAVMATSPQVRSTLENHSPMGRLARPEEMAEAAIWLASDKSSFVNAHALVVDGGSVAE